MAFGQLIKIKLLDGVHIPFFDAVRRQDYSIALVSLLQRRPTLKPCISVVSFIVYTGFKSKMFLSIIVVDLLLVFPSI